MRLCPKNFARTTLQIRWSCAEFIVYSFHILARKNLVQFRLALMCHSHKINVCIFLCWYFSPASICIGISFSPNTRQNDDKSSYIHKTTHSASISISSTKQLQSNPARRIVEQKSAFWFEKPSRCISFAWAESESRLKIRNGSEAKMSQVYSRHSKRYTSNMKYLINWMILHRGAFSLVCCEIACFKVITFHTMATVSFHCC